jgi:hypothetical protein
MRRILLVAALVAAALGLGTLAPPRAHAQAPEMLVWHRGDVRRCARADSLFGRLWRSHASLVRVGYTGRSDTTAIGTPVRTVSWETTSSRLVGTEAIARVRGRDAKADSAQIELTLRFLDSLYRAPAQAHVTLQIDDAAPVELSEPQVDYPEGIRASGVPVVVTVLLTPGQSFALARAQQVKGTMGPYPFAYFAWELWDINAIYRATVCGVE